MIRTLLKSILIYFILFTATLCIINIDRVCSRGYGMEGRLVPGFEKDSAGEVSLVFGH